MIYDEMSILIFSLIHNLVSRPEAKHQTRILLEQVGLTPAEDYQKRFPHELSGGEQQRVAIARALTMTPKILICDESLSMLDAQIQAEIFHLLKSLQRRMGLSILFITHDLSLASGFCNRVIVLDRGKIIEEGLAENLFKSPQSSMVKSLVNASPKLPSGV